MHVLGKMATYPIRSKSVSRSVASIIDQLDKLIVCCNNYHALPGWMLDHPKIDAHIPEKDLKDTGKFIPTDCESDYTVFLDDDLIYPPDYIAKTLREQSSLINLSSAVGYHGSWYTRPGPSVHPLKAKAWIGYKCKRSNPMWYRKTVHFSSRLDKNIRVEQLGTGVTGIPSRLVPPFSFMEGSEKFVDVRFARWCFENDIDLYCLKRPEAWVGETETEESIYETFTIETPRKVQAEIYTYASSLT